MGLELARLRRFYGRLFDRCHFGGSCEFRELLRSVKARGPEPEAPVHGCFTSEGQVLRKDISVSFDPQHCSLETVQRANGHTKQLQVPCCIPQEKKHTQQLVCKLCQLDAHRVDTDCRQAAVHHRIGRGRRGTNDTML